MKNSPEARTLDTETVTISKVEYQQLLNQTDLLKHQLAELKRMLFGVKSERFVIESSDHLSLGLDITSAQTPIEKTEAISYTRSKVSLWGVPPRRLTRYQDYTCKNQIRRCF